VIKAEKKKVNVESQSNNLEIPCIEKKNTQKTRINLNE